MTSVRLDRAGATATLTLDRPDQGNAIDMSLAEALDAAACECAGDPAIRCVVLTGAGRMFCVGGDIAAFAAAGDAAGGFLHDLATVLHRAVATLATMPKPLVALVNGPAAGAGVSLALLGDIVLAAGSAHFTAAYGAVGLTPDGGMSWLLPRLVGLRRAQEIILTNRRVGADEAAGIGLVTRTVPQDALAAEGRAVADALVAAPTAALGAARALLLDGAVASLGDHLAAEASAIGLAGTRTESREGVAAFLARRRPVFAQD